MMDSPQIKMITPSTAGRRYQGFTLTMAFSTAPRSSPWKTLYIVKMKTAARNIPFPIFFFLLVKLHSLSRRYFFSC